MSLIIALAVVGVATFAGLWLYGRASGTSQTIISAFGILRNVALAFSGVMLIITEMWPAMLLGAVLIMFAVYLGRSHYERLGGGKSLRKRIAG